MKKVKKVWLLLALACLLARTGMAMEIVKEVHVESFAGEPVQQEFAFEGQGYENFLLKVTNGDENGEHRISSAIISLNGVKVLSPADFNQKVANIQRAIVPVDNENTLSVTLRSNPGGYLDIQILAEFSLNLPPDPGSEGDETIEGVDVNNNGVRDDIERWIGLNFRDSEKTRMALTQAYYPLQNFMIHARDGDRDAVYDDMDALQRAGECLDYLFPDDVNRLMVELKAMVLNTNERSKAYIESSRILGGGTFRSAPFSKWKQSCTFDPDLFEN